MEESKDIANTEQEGDGDEFSELMENYTLKTAQAGSHLEGVIVDIIDNKVIVDIGQKTEGILDKKELLDWDNNLSAKVGDTITVVCKSVNMKEGYITVSKKQVDKEKGWTEVKRAFDNGEAVTGRISEYMESKRGFMVDMGVDMFLPLSQLDIRRVKNPRGYVGKEFEFKISRLNSRDMSGVVSRRSILEEERKEKIVELFDSLQVGDLVEGVVTSITDYGAFVNLGPLDGLVHKDNISYGRVNHPKEKLRKGDEVEARVLQLDKENQKISLGIKQKGPDPWIGIQDKYPVGTKLIAKVTKIVDFGAFIELEEGVEGLMHISDLTWEGKPNSVEEFVAVGDKLWVQVIELKPADKKIKLGLKQLEMRPEEKYLQEHKSGDVVKGVVKKVLKSRVFVELQKSVEGVIRISDISYFRIDSPEEFLKEKEEIEAMIIGDTLDSNYKVKLSLKHMSNKEWNDFFASHKPGDIINVTIKRVGEKGISAEISKNIEGFIRLNEVDEKRLTFEEIQAKVKVGDKREALIHSTDPDKKRITLSLRAVDKKKEREEIEKYARSDNDSVTTIGDLFENAIDKGK